MKVTKFGGTSLADAKQINKICDIVLADDRRRVVVVSAPGKRFADDIKVTDLLIECATIALNEQDSGEAADHVLQRFREIQSDLSLPEAITSELEADLMKRLSTNRNDAGRFTDLLKAAGEDFSARIVTENLKARGANAVYMNPGEAGMLLDGIPGHATLSPESNDLLAASLRKTLDDPEKPIVVFPGFFGVTHQGLVATFPRGGSDITGSILAAAIKAEIYENFTDVDEVYAVDPRLVPDVKHGIAEMTYREMRELAYAGFGVFHDEAIMPAYRAGIPINIRNTEKPSLPGTRIVKQRNIDKCSVLGIASASGFVAIYVDKFLMNHELGFGRRLLQILEDENISFEHIPTGIDNISVVIRGEGFTEAIEKRVIAKIQRELQPDAILVERDHAIIMLVGEGMQYEVGIAAQAAGALAKAGVNIEMINQGASEISIMFGVRSYDRERAVKALYEAFFKP